MYNLITILIIIVCVLIMLVVLVQNPKGSGLGATFGGGGSQLMGVQRTADFLEKATWTLAISLLALSLLTSFFVERGAVDVNKSEIEQQIQDAPDFPTTTGQPLPLNE